jgi:hypothetical protein
MDRQYERYNSKMSAIEVKMGDPLLDCARTCDTGCDDPYSYDNWHKNRSLSEQIRNGYSNFDFGGGRGAYLKADDSRFRGDD